MIGALKRVGTTRPEEATPSSVLVLRPQLARVSWSLLG